MFCFSLTPPRSENVLRKFLCKSNPHCGGIKRWSLLWTDWVVRASPAQMGLAPFWRRWKGASLAPDAACKHTVCSFPLCEERNYHLWSRKWTRTGLQTSRILTTASAAPPAWRGTLLIEYIAQSQVSCYKQSSHLNQKEQEVYREAVIGIDVGV